ncbi:MAG: T9SS type A sorting domain-containing protein [Bacteroidota bacterium]
MKRLNFFTLLLWLTAPYVALGQSIPTNPSTAIPPIGVNDPSNVPVCPGAPCAALPPINLTNCSPIVSYGTNPQVKFDLEYNALYATPSYNLATMPDPMTLVIKARATTYWYLFGGMIPITSSIQIDGQDSLLFTAPRQANNPNTGTPFYKFDVDFNIHYTALNAHEIHLDVNFWDMPYPVHYVHYFDGEQFVSVPHVMVPLINYDPVIETVITFPTESCVAPDSHRMAAELQDEQLPADLKVIPNPTQDFGILSFDLASEQTVSVDLYNLQGQLVRPLMAARSLMPGLHQEKLNLSDLSAGLYIVKAQTPSGHRTYKLMKQ